jgi:hypothetical protein
MRVQSHEAVVLIVPLLLAFSGCSGRHPDTTTLKQADRLVLYEGLPHQMYESQALEAEKKAKPTVTLHGFSFYRETLEVKAGDDQRLKTLMSDPGSFEAFSGEKRCGGFHPDYAVEWSAGGQVYQALLCFGCWEVKIYGPKGEAIYDIRGDARDQLKALLEPYRKNRPPFKQTI